MKLSLNSRRGFTLTELMVVMLILIILTAMTVAAVNFSMSAERSRAAARQVQSYLAGARDRAIYEAKLDPDQPKAVGVRFLIDPDVPNTISSMIYIEESDEVVGQVEVFKKAGSPPFIMKLRDSFRRRDALDWSGLVRKELLRKGDRIRIPAGDDGFPYTIQSIGTWVDPDDPDQILRERIVFEPEFKGAIEDGEYIYPYVQLLVAPVIRANQEPMLLPRGIVIDGNSDPRPNITDSRSKLPRAWTLGDGRLDIMFSPRGTVTGRAATSGLIHFYLSEAADVERLNAAGIWTIPSDTPYGTADGDDVIGDRILVTLFPQTGAISSHPVNPTDSNADKRADDPYLYAETGEVAGE